MSAQALAIGALIIGGASALATYRQGQAGQMVEEAKARQEELQGSIEAANYKEQANQSLKNLERVLAANLARGFAGNMDPLSSGSTQSTIQRYNMREGVNQFTVSRDNATIAKKMAAYQAAQYRTAGKNIMQAAKTSAFIQLGQAVVTAGQTDPNIFKFTGGAKTATTTTTFTGGTQQARLTAGATPYAGYRR